MGKENEAFGLPKGTVRGIAFLMLILNLCLMNLTVCIGAALGDWITFAEFKTYFLLVLPLITGAFGYYYGQKSIDKLVIKKED